MKRRPNEDHLCKKGRLDDQGRLKMTHLVTLLLLLSTLMARLRATTTRLCRWRMSSIGVKLQVCGLKVIGWEILWGQVYSYTSGPSTVLVQEMAFWMLVALAC